VLTAVGVALAAELAVEAAVRLSTGAPAGTPFWIGVATSLPFVGLLIGAGYRLPTASLSPDRCPRLVAWSAAGAGFLLLSVGLIAAFVFDAALALIGTARWSVAVGAGIGLLVGAFEARAIEQRVSAREAAVRADEQERRQELLGYLNALLRHEVLNAANVIDGYAARLEGGGDPEAAATIRRRADELAGVTEDVRTLLDAAEGSTATDPVDLAALVERRVAALERRVDAVDADADCPASAPVAADDLLWRAVDNLLNNAVDHNDAPVPSVEASVAVDEAAGVARLRVADDGPGVPEERRASLFEYTTTGRSDHGLGLAVTRALVERYAGGIELAETGPEGSVFAVELPLAEGDAEATVPGPAPGEASTASAGDRGVDSTTATAAAAGPWPVGSDGAAGSTPGDEGSPAPD